MTTVCPAGCSAWIASSADWEFHACRGRAACCRCRRSRCWTWGIGAQNRTARPAGWIAGRAVLGVLLRFFDQVFDGRLEFVVGEIRCAAAGRHRILAVGGRLEQRLERRSRCARPTLPCRRSSARRRRRRRGRPCRWCCRPFRRCAACRPMAVPPSAFRRVRPAGCATRLRRRWHRSGALPIIDSGQTIRIRTAATATVIHMIVREECDLLLSMASLVCQR
jgi:hypothetical protein